MAQKSMVYRFLKLYKVITILNNESHIEIYKIFMHCEVKI